MRWDFLDFRKWQWYSKDTGGDFIYVFIIMLLSIWMAYYIFGYYCSYQKLKYILSKQVSVLKAKKNKSLILSSYCSRIQEKIYLLGNPYHLTLYRYLFIKYVLSIVIFCLLYIRSNIVLAISYFICIFFLLDIMFLFRKKYENAILIKELSNIVQVQILLLSAQMPLYEVLKYSTYSIQYKRFKEEFTSFTTFYLMYQYNIYQAIDTIKNKFYSNELQMYFSILQQGEKEGNLKESFENFKNTLSQTYFKYVRMKASKRMMILIFATLLSLLNISLTVMYPIVIQISQSLNGLFQ